MSTYFSPSVLTEPAEQTALPYSSISKERIPDTPSAPRNDTAEDFHMPEASTTPQSDTMADVYYPQLSVSITLSPGEDAGDSDEHHGINIADKNDNVEDDSNALSGDDNDKSFVVPAHKRRRAQSTATPSITGPVQKKKLYRFINGISNPKAAKSAIRRAWQLQSDKMIRLTDLELSNLYCCCQGMLRSNQYETCAKTDEVGHTSSKPVR